MDKKKSKESTDSNLLVVETPVVIIKTLAEEFKSPNKSMLLQFIYYHTRSNKNIRDGFSWCYFSISNLHKKYFPFLSESTLSRTLSELRESNIILTGNYNKMKYDKTIWYRINYDELDTRLCKYSRNNKNQYIEKSIEDNIDLVKITNDACKMTESCSQNGKMVTSNEKNPLEGSDVNYTKENKEHSIEEYSENRSESNLSNSDKLPEDKSSGENFSKVKDKNEKNIIPTEENKNTYSSNHQLEHEPLSKLTPEEIGSVFDAMFGSICELKEKTLK